MHFIHSPPIQYSRPRAESWMAYVRVCEPRIFRFSSVLHRTVWQQPVRSIEIDCVRLFISAAASTNAAKRRLDRQNVSYGPGIPDLPRNRDGNRRVTDPTFDSEIEGHQRLAFAESLPSVPRAGHLSCHEHQHLLICGIDFGEKAPEFP